MNDESPMQERVEELKGRHRAAHAHRSIRTLWVMSLTTLALVVLALGLGAVD